MDNYLNSVINDRYEIQEIVGIGGMSVVYKAYDRVDDRVVAVKILKDEFMANEEFRMRFKNESKAISVLSHPNIVKVYDVSFGEKLQYIVMEYVEGITLKEYIDRQKVLDIKEAEHFVIQILRALQHAHDKGIVHRDIKPQNIILLPNANIKVTDFGIARFNHIESKNVDESSAIGSVHYVSPEQAKGEYTDGRSDIYSVGVVLYEMLTGKLPFDAENDSYVALMQLQDVATRPSLINPSIPLGLEQITMRAMQKNPADRYQSAAEFLSDLYEFKKNPQIKFDYTYFVDSEPTKVIPPAPTPVTGDIGFQKAQEDEYAENLDDDAAYDEEVEEEEDDEEEEEEEEERSVTVPILIGIAVALVVVIAAIMLLAFGDTIRAYFGGNTTSTEESGESFWQKLDFLGLFSSEKIEVPNFINMDFKEVFEKYPDLAIDPEPQYVYNTTYESGKVIEQSPEAGEKVSPDTVIKLYVATNSAMVQIPDVKGYNYTEAESILVAKGFTVEMLLAFDDTVDENTVVYTDPTGNSYAAYGSTVYVYYSSSDADSLNSTRVPNVVGDQLSVAKQKILAAGLKVGAVTYNASSAALKDYVIGQNPTNGDTVKTGTVVNLVVGNGVQGSSTTTFQITLPEMGGQTATVRTYLNNVAYDTYSAELDGSALTISFTGSGTDNTFTVYVDSTKIYSGNIDFTKTTGKVSNVYTYTYTSRESVPDVIGLSQADAISSLKSHGFGTVNVETVASNEVAKGVVVNQSPASSTLTQYSTSTAVTIYVSSGPEATAPSSDAPTAAPTQPSETESTSSRDTQSSSEEQSSEENSTFSDAVFD